MRLELRTLISRNPHGKRRGTEGGRREQVLAAQRRGRKDVVHESVEMAHARCLPALSLSYHLLAAMQMLVPPGNPSSTQNCPRTAYPPSFVIPYRMLFPRWWWGTVTVTQRLCGLRLPVVIGVSGTVLGDKVYLARNNPEDKWVP